MERLDIRPRPTNTAWWSQALDKAKADPILYARMLAAWSQAQRRAVGKESSYAKQTR